VRYPAVCSARYVYGVLVLGGLKVGNLSTRRGNG